LSIAIVRLVRFFRQETGNYPSAASRHRPVMPPNEVIAPLAPSDRAGFPRTGDKKCDDD